MLGSVPRGFGALDGPMLSWAAQADGGYVMKKGDLIDWFAIGRCLPCRVPHNMCLYGDHII